ncbi:uncharacterized protein LOC110691228 isoform X1 [Chenopodium quinoa]|uniref:uncharacterized protein LOC110691228 isoform X1 n=1 Tax=Chenopodium quinoa TaxID=63459 RepID=UPI000B76D4F3|nr:uncharacterized protein LOC110691228 isoform X1 [Chenopodium quinoa]
MCVRLQQQQIRINFEPKIRNSRWLEKLIPTTMEVTTLLMKIRSLLLINLLISISRFYHHSGGHGQPVSYRQHGDDTAERSMGNHYETLLQRGLEAHLALVSQFMHQGLLPMHFVNCE